MSAMEISYSVSLPEFDRIIHGTPVTTNERDENGSQLTQDYTRTLICSSEKAKKLAVLKHQETIMRKNCYCFFIIITQLILILAVLARLILSRKYKIILESKNQGYKVDRLPADRQEFINELIEHATNDRSFMNDKLIKNSDGKMTLKYQGFYQILPEKVQKN